MIHTKVYECYCRCNVSFLFAFVVNLNFPFCSLFCWYIQNISLCTFFRSNYFMVLPKHSFERFKHFESLNKFDGVWSMKCIYHVLKSYWKVIALKTWLLLKCHNNFTLNIRFFPLFLIFEEFLINMHIPHENFMKCIYQWKEI